MSMRAQGLGAVLAIVGALGIVLPLVAGWSALPLGILTGLRSRGAGRDRRHPRRRRAPRAETRVLGRDCLGCTCRDESGHRPWRQGPGERAATGQPNTGQVFGKEVVGNESRTTYRIPHRRPCLGGRSGPAPAVCRSSGCSRRRDGCARSGSHSHIETRPGLIGSGQGGSVRASKVACTRPMRRST